MNNKTSSGYDGISNETNKCCSQVVEQHLSEAFNECLKKRTFPKCLKLANVIALHRKGDFSDPENYRPMSLPNSTKKVFEKRFCNRMNDFINKIILLAPVRLGFRSKNSCIHGISEIKDFIRDTIDEKLKSQACFIDLKKAFDSLDHSQLHWKFYNCGFRGPIVDGPTDHLIDSWQYVFDKEH